MRIVKCFLLPFFLMGFISCNAGTLTMEKVKETVREKYGDVAHLNIKQFLEIPADDYLLVDVRDSDEFNVSHLEHALNLKDPSAIRNELRNKGFQSVVIYCSVGYRSSDVARKLKDLKGVTVYNFEGGIFDWFNQGYKIVNSHGLVNEVHPYNKKWGELLSLRER